jgi:hypothetical protein
MLLQVGESVEALANSAATRLHLAELPAGLFFGPPAAAVADRFLPKAIVI